MKTDCNLHLVTPFPCPARPQEHPHPIFLTVDPQRPDITRQPLPILAPAVRLPPPLSKPGPVIGVRKLAQGQLHCLWSCDMTVRSERIAKKLSAPPFPVADIPRLLELDINQGRVGTLCSLLSRSGLVSPTVSLQRPGLGQDHSLLNSATSGEARKRTLDRLSGNRKGIKYCRVAEMIVFNIQFLSNVRACSMYVLFTHNNK